MKRYSVGMALCTALGAAAGHACGCVAAGTRIATPTGEVDVATLRIGDEVLCIDVRTGLVHTTVVTSLRRARRECLALRVGSRRLVCTPDHPIYAPEVDLFEPASRFADGRHRRVQLAGPERWRSRAVDEVEPYAGVHEVFDLGVASPHHDYVAEGLLVHNKTVIGSPIVGFICTPSEGQDACPAYYHCCSDDPAAVGGLLPSYAMGNPGEGVSEPLFAADNNALGRQGFCVGDLQYYGADVLEAVDCPFPCNPLWNDYEIEVVCGQDRTCCQTQELSEADCILDADTGRWRPMDGRDAEAAARRGEDGWGAPGGTHQDPDFRGCEAFAGDRESEAFFACARQLSVADQRGYCMASSSYSPTSGPGCGPEELADPCEDLNDREGR